MGSSLKKISKSKQRFPLREKRIMLAHDFYEVETVLAKKRSETGPKYLVSWKGYNSYQNEWISHLPDYFEKEWGASGNKPFQEHFVFDDMVDLACLILSGVESTQTSQ